MLPSSTYSRSPSGLTATDLGAPPTVTVPTRVRVTVSMTETVPDVWLTTKTHAPSGEAASDCALKAQHPRSRGIVVTRVTVFVSMTASDCCTLAEVGSFCSST